MAEAPNTRTMSLCGESSSMARATSAATCGVRFSATTVLPERASLSSVTRSVLSSTLALIEGSIVWTTATDNGR